MTWSAWLPLALVCLLGAMSPGPSSGGGGTARTVAVVVRGMAIVCAMAHGVGILLWALSDGQWPGRAADSSSPTWFAGVQLAGAGFLLYLGIRVLMSQSSAVESAVEEMPRSAPDSSRRGAGLEGFVIALSNPKIALFFLRRCSASSSSPTRRASKRLLIAGTAAGVDALWYSLSLCYSSRKRPSYRGLQRRATLLNRLFGGILIVLAISVVVT